MKILSGTQMKKLMENSDIRNEDELVLSVAVMLEKFIIADYPENITIVCGKGRNGRYGLQLASLMAVDTLTDIVLVTDEAVQLPYYNVRNVYTQRAIREAILSSTCIVDCIYGVEDETSGYPYDYWIKWINESNSKVISCDIPSGLNRDNGSVKECVRADVTVCIDYPKLGYYLYPGNQFTGDIHIEKVGIDNSGFNWEQVKTETLSYRDCITRLPLRSTHSHKGTYGRVLLIGGSDNTVGACVLCARMILKAGAGLLTVLSYPETVRTLHETLPEAMTLTIDEQDISGQLEKLELDKYTLIVIGPGLGRNENTEKIISHFLNSDKDLVIDADGLFYLKKHLNDLYRNAMTVLTPHLIEYQRIFEYHQERVIDDLMAVTEEYPTLTVVLKSENTLTAHGGHITVNRTGNNALAKGGSGDVLCGLIGGLLAQKKDMDVIPTAVCMHSLAADRWILHSSAYSMLASDLINEIEKILFEMTEDR